MNARALSGRERTVTVSLRISETAYKALQEEARKQNISFNTIANQILVAYSEYDRHFKKLGMLRLSLPTFAHMLNSSPEEAVAEAGRLAGTGVFPSLILSTMGELSVSGILDWLKRMGTYSNLTDYSEISHGGKICVTMAHEFGQRGSLFFSNYVDALFGLAGKQIKPTQLRNSITFEV
jgi:hypothetical protein